MTVSAAQAAAQTLRTALLDHGVRAVSIELQTGVGPSADPWGPAPFQRGLGHHIASRPSQGLTPGLSLVKKGRTGTSPLQGPLCNGYGGYDRIARIITMGWANHPGAGGPWMVPGWGTVPKDNGRPYIFGWEFEGGYEPYTDEMHDFMARCGAGTLDWLGNAPLECWDEHKGWAGPRKPDRIGYTTESGRARIAAVRSAPKEDVMNAEQEKMLKFVYDRVAGRDVQRWLKLVNGKFVVLDKPETGAWPARSADVADIITLTEIVQAQHADLSEKIRALGPDPAAILDALRAGLGNDLAQQVVVELGKKINSPTE